MKIKTILSKTNKLYEKILNYDNKITIELTLKQQHL